MKILKKCAVLFICLCFALNLPFINNRVKADYDSAYVLKSSNYGETVSLWNRLMTANEDELENGKSKATPGARNNFYGAAGQAFPESALADRQSLKYYYEGTDYAYGIDSLGNETIAFRQSNGGLFDAVNGAGKLYLYGTNGNSLVLTGGVKNFTETSDENGNTVLNVNYYLSGGAQNSSEAGVSYTFEDARILIKYNIKAQSTAEFNRAKSKIVRTYKNGYTSSRAQVSSKWVYPDNLDYPYQEFDSLIYIDRLTPYIGMYTSLFDKSLPTEWNMTENMSGNNIPIYFDNGTELSFTYEYAVSFVNLLSERQSPDYLGVFKCKNSDFAAGIAPVTPTGDNSTVFTGDSVDLNINVTNLKSGSIKFSLRYDIRSYSGAVTAAGLFTDNTVLSGLDANRTVTVSGEYGIYWLNLYVITDSTVYYECWPFALLPEYEYKYSASSPFGIASAAAGKVTANGKEYTLSKYTDTAKLMLKIGTANIRGGAEDGYLQMMSVLKSNGITKMNGGITDNNTDPQNIDNYVAKFLSAAEKQKEYVDAMECGNEMSLYSLKDKNDPAYIPADELYPVFYNCMYRPTYDALKQNYPDITYVPTQASACETSWIEKFFGFGDIPSIWDEIKVLTSHIYGNPWMPDVYGMNKPSYGGDLWNIEAGLQRIKSCLSDPEHLDANGKEKDFYLTEVGYPTAPLSETSVCLRTQADYTVRIGALGAAYGVDRIQYYQFYDRTSYNGGFDNYSDQYNYGLFYKQDYYGTIKPKPAGIAFAVMTRNLESIRKDSGRISEKYDEGYDTGGVRAFSYDTDLHGKVFVAYSNSEILSNGKKNINGNTNMRTPTLPWNSQWKKYDNTVFDTDNEEVRVIDIMGNETVYKAENGKVTIPLTGSPVYIYNIY